MAGDAFRPAACGSRSPGELLDIEGDEWTWSEFSAETQLSDAKLLVAEDSLKKVERREQTLEGVKLPIGK